MPIILNFLVLLFFVGLHWYLSAQKGWFQHRHVRLSQTAWFAFTILTFWIPFTPFFIDSMVFASILYFGAEWVYQKVKWSPLTELFGQEQETEKSEEVA